MSPVVAVEIAATDGAMLRGQLWTASDAWVILLHDQGDEEDLDRWAPLVPALTARGWTVLAVDLRGHGGSDGAWDHTLAEEDVAAVFSLARSRGAVFVAVAGAGSGASVALKCAAATRPDALVLLSPSIAPDQPLTGLRGSGEAKLFVVGGDRAARADAQRLSQAAIGWVLLVNLPAAEQGTALLHGAVAPHLIEHVVGFLAEQRFLASHRPGRDSIGQQPVQPDRANSRGTEPRERNGIR